MTDAGSSPEDVNQESFFDNILKPGSSFHPTFLLILDGVFAFLLVILLALAFMTSGNIHLILLTVIELGLWASVKWFINEWNKVQEDANAATIQRGKLKEE